MDIRHELNWEFQIKDVFHFEDMAKKGNVHFLLCKLLFCVFYIYYHYLLLKRVIEITIT